MSIGEADLINQLMSTLLAIFRIGAFFAAGPILGATFITGPVRAGLALIMALIIQPLIPAVPAIDPLSIQMLVVIGQEIMMGVAMAFVVQLLFQMFVLAGQAIAMQAGLGFANMVDPSNGVSVPVVSQFYLMMVTLLWLTLGGHLVMIQVLVDSFTVHPIGNIQNLVQGMALLPELGSWLFAGALLIALPAIAAMLIVNLAFGIMTRTAPQLNVFALGFPFTLLCGLLAMYIGLDGFLPRFEVFAAEALGYVREVMSGRDG